jgi:hypothetical protein
MAEERLTRDPDAVDQPHDVLAADEFAMPTRDHHPPDPHGEDHEAHDVLAADEFAMPTRGSRAPDPHIDDPEPHDVLAADEFAMPGIGAHHEPADTTPARRSLVPLALAIALLLVLRRRRS